jgi:pimeloyl-ACP methyl ester carboxylesterase
MSHQTSPANQQSEMSRKSLSRNQNRICSKAWSRHEKIQIQILNSGEDRRPTLTWPRQIPIEGVPKEVVEIVTAYGEWLSKSDVPKLFINAEPGAILVGRARDFCRTWPNQEEVTVMGKHFIQEDSPDEIGQSIAKFIRKINHMIAN